MVKFPKLKIEIAISIKLSVLLTIFNTASMSSNYWLKHVDKKTNTKLLMGLWNTCNSVTGKCVARSGITHDTATLWSLFIHIFFVIGTIFNFLSLLLLILIFVFKQFKTFQIKLLMKLLEIVNALLISAFAILIISFCVFISTSCTYSLWLQGFSLCSCVVSINLLTRIFAKLYYSFVL
jgi:hypothetical protein